MVHPRKERIPERLTNASRQRHSARARQQGGLFLKGPIPMAWLKKAATLPGKALPIALAIWFLHGVNGGAADIVVTNRVVERIVVVDRKTRYRALEALENAGLIAVVRRRGAASRVTILHGKIHA